jgi:hypothetical protein
MISESEEKKEILSGFENSVSSFGKPVSMFVSPGFVCPVLESDFVVEKGLSVTNLYGL